MKLKRTFLSISIFCLTVFSVNASCYSEWYDSYSAAEEELASDLSRCQYSSWVSRCSYEAKLSYSATIESAGNEFYNCLDRR